MKETIKRLFYLLLILSSALLVRKCSDGSLKLIQGMGKTMGTTYSYKVYTNQKSKIETSNDIQKILENVNQDMSTYISSSSISRFNQSREVDEEFEVSSDFMHVLRVSKKVHEQTDGIFDPTISPLIKAWGFGENGAITKVPSDKEIKSLLLKTGFDKLKLHENNRISKSHPDLEINLSAIAKGFGVDKVALYLESISNNYLIEIGGEVYAKGVGSGSGWKVGIEQPNELGRVVSKIIELNGECVASSGDYRNINKINDKKYSHSISPKSGLPVENDISGATVIHKDCTHADAYATSLMLLGSKRASKLSTYISNYKLFIKKPTK